jgi:hypothetical protein
MGGAHNFMGGIGDNYDLEKIWKEHSDCCADNWVYSFELWGQSVDNALAASLMA